MEFHLPNVGKFTQIKAFDRIDDEDGHYQNYFKEVENEPKKIGPPNFEHWENA